MTQRGKRRDGAPSVFRVHKRMLIQRKGRGFSREEVKAAKLTVDQARNLKIPIDPRRKTVYEHNVNFLKVKASILKAEMEPVKVPEETR